MKARTPILAGLLIAMPFVAHAQDAEDRLPPSGSQPLSAIVAKVEQRDGFRFIDEIEWEEDTGTYEVVYYTTDRAKVEIHYDAATGEAK
jgi:uncharacterized membrane protein YkoI